MSHAARLCPALIALLVVATACAVSDPRPVYHTTTAASEGAVTLVVGVERDPDNTYTVRTLAREMAFALAQRGRAAVDLGTFADEARVRGLVLPPWLIAKLVSGVADEEALGWLRGERLGALILLEVGVYDQVWGVRGKRTRVGLTARGRQLGGGEETWRAFTTPEVEDEPGQGFQIATDAALSALVRVIMGESELPATLSNVKRGLPNLQLRW
jgi:hypothetical protein